LRLLVIALHKLPRCEQLLFRGVKLDVTGPYQKGKKVTWWSVSSSTAVRFACFSFCDLFLLCFPWVLFFRRMSLLAWLPFFILFYFILFYFISRSISLFVFFSQSIEVMETEQFCGSTGQRTVFQIQSKYAVNIQPFSAVQAENERVLVPVQLKPCSAHCLHGAMFFPIFCLPFSYCCVLLCVHSVIQIH
jgi:hypothetical protein